MRGREGFILIVLPAGIRIALHLVEASGPVLDIDMQHICKIRLLAEFTILRLRKRVTTTDLPEQSRP